MVEKNQGKTFFRQKNYFDTATNSADNLKGTLPSDCALWATKAFIKDVLCHGLRNSHSNTPLISIADWKKKLKRRERIHCSTFKELPGSRFSCRCSFDLF